MKFGLFFGIIIETFALFSFFYYNLLLFSSRLSLAGSRQSLAGSRSHLASPAERPTSNISMTTDKGDTPVTVQTDISTNNSKRASFVEVFIRTIRFSFMD